MARIRTIKPEFPQSESMGRVSREARLCFILLWTLSDDAGRLRGNSRMLASLLYPYDDDAKKLMDKWVTELAKEGCITWYAHGGDTYIQINAWLMHQKIDKPSASKLPPFDETSRILANPREGSFTPAAKEVAEGKGREGKGEDAANASTSSFAKPETVSQQVWDDYLKVRKAKKAPAMTATAMAGIEREAEVAGIDIQKAFEVCCERNWVGFKADWYTGQTANVTSIGSGRLVV